MEAGRPSRTYARSVRFLRVLVIAALVAAAWASAHYLPGIASQQDMSVGGLLPSKPSAQQAEAEAARLFGSSLLPRIAVVQRNPHGLSPRQQRRIVRLAMRLDTRGLHGFPRGTRAVPYINTAGIVPGARERSTTAVTYLAFPKDVAARTQRNLAYAYARAVSVPGAPAAATGFVPGTIAESDAVDRSLGWVELGSVLAVLLIIGIHLRSLFAPLITLGAAVVAYVISIGVISYLARLQGLEVYQEAEPILVVLVLGVVTDYSVFFLSGVRDRVRAGEPHAYAQLRVTTLFAPIVLTAGLVVAAGLATLRIASVGFVQQLGPAMAVCVLVGLAVAVSFVPAAIATFGRLAFWPGLRVDDPIAEPASKARRAVVHATSRRLSAVPLLVLVCAALVAGATGLTRMNVGLTPVAALDAGSPPARAADAAAKGFVAGVVSPTEIVLRAPGIASRSGALVRMGRELRAQPEVGAVIGAGSPRLPDRAGPVFAARSGDAARYFVAFRHAPYGSAGVADLSRLERRMPALATRAGLGYVSISYAGDTALAKESVARIDRDLIVVALAAALVDLLLLAAFLRALLAPLLMVASSALAIAATFGITALFFHDVLGTPDITYYVPLAAGVLLLSLGTDYNLFVVGRIWQEAADKDVRAAIRAAVPRASRAISIAGLAFACSFGTLAIVPLASFREMAFAVGVGVLIDTFLVRTLLLPSLLSAFGRRSWWPGLRSRRRRLEAAVQ
jgi:putative drug exporter of the RND superfamily